MSAGRSFTSPGPKMAHGASHKRSTCCPRVGFVYSTPLCGMANREKPSPPGLIRVTSIPSPITASTLIRLPRPSTRTNYSRAAKFPPASSTCWRRVRWIQEQQADISVGVKRFTRPSSHHA